MLRLLRALLVLPVVLMMPGFTYFRRALVWFVRFDFFASGRGDQDERRWILGAVGCASGTVCELAAHSRQGSRVRPFVFITNLPAMEKTRVKSEVCSGSTANVHDYFLLNSGLCGQHVDGPARRRLISFVFRPPVRNDMVSCVDFDWRQRGSDDDDDDDDR